MMKKTYVKPQLYCERFILAQHVAACDAGANSMDENSCVITKAEDPWVGQFSDSNGSCTKHDLEAYCWTNGSSSGFVVIFGS